MLAAMDSSPGVVERQGLPWNRQVASARFYKQLLISLAKLAAAARSNKQLFRCRIKPRTG